MTYKGFSRAALSAAILTLAACGGGSGGGGGTTSVPEGTPGSVERLIFPVVSASNRSLFDMYTTDGSAEGTGLLKDFNEGQPAIQQFNGRNPILFDDGKFYFSAQSPNEGRELRVSDAANCLGRLESRPAALREGGAPILGGAGTQLVRRRYYGACRSSTRESQEGAGRCI